MRLIIYNNGLVYCQFQETRAPYLLKRDILAFLKPAEYIKDGQHPPSTMASTRHRHRVYLLRITTLLSP